MQINLILYDVIGTSNTSCAPHRHQINSIVRRSVSLIIKPLTVKNNAEAKANARPIILLHLNFGASKSSELHSIMPEMFVTRSFES